MARQKRRGGGIKKKMKRQKKEKRAGVEEEEESGSWRWTIMYVIFKYSTEYSAIDVRWGQGQLQYYMCS